MPPPHCHFTTRAPSPTTIEYTVSTSPPSQNLKSQCLHILILLIRVLVGVLTLSAVTAKFVALRSVVPMMGIGQEYLRDVPLSGFGPAVAVLMFLVLRRYHTEESLLILRTLGIQTTTLSSSYLVPATTRFIPTSQIRDIFIHEAFRGFEVRFYLCVVVQGEGEAVVVFPKLLPNRHILEQVWRGARECLYEPKTINIS